jgi:hypothetical protein
LHIHGGGFPSGCRRFFCRNLRVGENTDLRFASVLHFSDIFVPNLETIAGGLGHHRDAFRRIHIDYIRTQDREAMRRSLLLRQLI